MKDYDAKLDSSPGTDDLRAYPEDANAPDDNPGVAFDGLILDVEPVVINGEKFPACHCGCREPVNGKSSFKQGHDQRLVGKLVRAGRAGVEVCISDGALIHSSAANIASHLFSTDGGVAKVAAGIALARRPAKTSAKQAADKIVQTIEGSVKQGRWEYPARKTGAKVERNTARDGSGEWVEADAAKFVAA